LKEKLLRSTNLKREDIDRKKLKELYENEINLSKNLEKMKSERDDAFKAFKRIALLFYDYSYV
jgi:hypothetical protein